MHIYFFTIRGLNIAIQISVSVYCLISRLDMLIFQLSKVPGNNFLKYLDILSLYRVNINQTTDNIFLHLWSVFIRKRSLDELIRIVKWPISIPFFVHYKHKFLVLHQIPVFFRNYFSFKRVIHNACFKFNNIFLISSCSYSFVF